MNLDSLPSILGLNEDEVAREIEKCVRLADDSLREVRTISYLLYPPMLEEVGLKSAIAWYVEGFSKRSHIRTTLEVDPGFGRLAPDAELALFRVLQESLTNVHRHSGSSSATIRLSIKSEKAILEIQDQGQGIPPKLLKEAGQDWMGSLGLGLRGMNERLRQLGGRLEISSTAQGTTVTASVPPIQDAARAHSA
jgi:signal transduction histidine kinase